MLVLLFSLVSVSWYLLAAYLLMRGMHSVRENSNRTALLLWLLAMLGHASALIAESITPFGIDLSLFNAISVSALFISLILLIVCFHRRKLSALGIIILPLSALCVILAPIETSDNLVGNTISLGIRLHIVSSLLAYSLLITASILAIAMHRQINYLKMKDKSKYNIVSRLPTLDLMESFMFLLIKLGILLLTISLVSGWIYHDNLFAQHLMHKAVLSISAWVIFGIVLIGKQLYGWRTNTAVGLVLTATGLLITAYSGSKFVLEVVLDRI